MNKYLIKSDGSQAEDKQRKKWKQYIDIFRYGANIYKDKSLRNTNLQPKYYNKKFQTL